MTETTRDFKADQPIIRRVRLELSRSVEPSYEDWLASHIQEIMRLTDADGNPLLVGAHSRKGIGEDSPAVFITDFCFPSQEALNYYNAHHLATMRGRIFEAYPEAATSTSPFKYSFALSSDPLAFEGEVSRVRGLTDIIKVGSLGRG